MGLFNVSISDEDRPRVDALIAVLNRLATLGEVVVNQKQLEVKVDLVNKLLPNKSA